MDSYGKIRKKEKEQEKNEKKIKKHLLFFEGLSIITLALKKCAFSSVGRAVDS